MTRRGNPDGERRKLFRRMEWIYVYAPPLLAALVGIVGGLALAFLIPIEGMSFRVRWVLAVGLLLGVPTIVYLVREKLSR